MNEIKSVTSNKFRWVPKHPDEIGVQYAGLWSQSGVSNCIEIHRGWVVIEHPEDKEEWDHQWVPVIFVIDSDGGVALCMPDVVFSLRIYLGTVDKLTSEFLVSNIKGQAEEYQLPILNFLVDNFDPDRIVRIIKVAYSHMAEMEDSYYGVKRDHEGKPGLFINDPLWIDCSKVEEGYRELDKSRVVKLNVENPYDVKVEVTEPEELQGE